MEPQKSLSGKHLPDITYAPWQRIAVRLNIRAAPRDMAARSRQPGKRRLYGGTRHVEIPIVGHKYTQEQQVGSNRPDMSERKSETERHRSHDLAVEEAKPEIKRPPLYRVLLINDDFTPMEFVVDILETIFGMERTRATQVMLEVHTKGKGVCGVYSYEIAETKVAQVMGLARQHQHPLLCTMEQT